MAVVKVVSRRRRAIIASGVLVVALVAMLVPSAAPGSIPRNQPSILCPLINPPGCCGPVNGVRVAVVPCCPVPTAMCCGPVAAPTCCAASPCSSGLSIAATPNPAREGHAATISGTLTGGTVASQTVALWERRAGQTAFSDVASTKTDASGAFRFVRAVQTNAEWYAKTASSASPTLDESVLASVVLHPSSLRPPAGAKLMLSGTIAPSHAGERVSLQRLRRGHWVTIARPRLNARSGFAVAQRMRARSVARLRVVLGADARNAQSVSGVVVISAR